VDDEAVKRRDRGEGEGKFVIHGTPVRKKSTRMEPLREFFVIDFDTMKISSLV
jgi:hypothetical protein